MTDDEQDAVRLRLDLAYDGTAFSGWAKQAEGLRTVQGVLEDALRVAVGPTGERPRLTVAGRTDTGVHATGQVAHLDLTPGQLDHLGRGRRGGFDGPAAARRITAIARAGDVVVHAVSLAAPGFDARFSADWRRYEYRIADRPEAVDPLQRHRVLALPHPLDVDAMQTAVDGLLGLHDFAAYCRPRPFATTIRTLQSMRWGREPDGVLVARVQADAFCHGMVRSLVGAAIAVGLGRLEPDRPAALLAETRRSNVFPVAPALGLTLTEVGYPDAAGLAAQAERARRRRRLSVGADLGYS